ncbi:uncharacterized protein LOC113324020 [Papaver somniferum]|uniref:uncharacterized protein LOC113324020 n=1 Tax=Papaver somniferum TaxID=3469 RepID=UPI000E6F5EC5|nr:uncharacterized protein LOC113324020 [Papaver somniferum]
MGDLWNLEVAPAIKIFLWKCAHEILPTNAKTASILHYIDPICKICKSGEETMTHMFLNFPAATDVWHHMFGESHGLFDHQLSFMDCFNTWFQHTTNSENISTYATTCWFIWKARCDLVLQNIKPNYKKTTLSIQQHLCDYNKIQNLAHHALNTQGHISETGLQREETGFHVGIPQQKQDYGKYVDSRGHTGQLGASGSTGGAELAFGWAEEK